MSPCEVAGGESGTAGEVVGSWGTILPVVVASEGEGVTVVAKGNLSVEASTDLTQSNNKTNILI